MSRVLLSILGWLPLIKALSDKKFKITFGLMIFALSLRISTLASLLIKGEPYLSIDTFKGEILLIG